MSNLGVYHFPLDFTTEFSLILDFFQLCKGREHLFRSCCIELYRHLIVSGSVLHLFYSSLTKFHMGNPVACNVIQALFLGSLTLVLSPHFKEPLINSLFWAYFFVKFFVFIRAILYYMWYNNLEVMIYVCCNQWCWQL